MKQFKMAFSLCGLLGIFILSGCMGGGSSGSSGVNPATNTNNTLNNTSTLNSTNATQSPLITSFTL